MRRPCGFPLCPETVTGKDRYCKDHKTEAAKQDNLRRGTAAERGYGYRWRKYCQWFLRQPENILCACGCKDPATVVDHIQAVTGPDDPLFWEPANHQGLTHACHNRKTILVDKKGPGAPR